MRRACVFAGAVLLSIYLLWFGLLWSISEAMCGPEGCTHLSAAESLWHAFKASLFIRGDQ